MPVSRNALWVVQFGCGECAVVQQYEDPAGVIGVGVPGLAGEQGDGVLEPGAVFGDRDANRVLGVRVFGGRVDEVATVEAR
jgi:hypothetical protein